MGIGVLVVGVAWLAAFFPIVGALAAGVAAVLVALVATGFVPAPIVAAAVIAVPIAVVCSVALTHRREREALETDVAEPSAAERAGRAPQRSRVGVRSGHDV